MTTLRKKLIEVALPLEAINKASAREKSLIIEYDGVEFHTRNPDVVTAHNFDQEYLEYDVQRQLELEGFGYTFLRINKFTLLPRRTGETPADVLNGMLERAFA
jgi:very-short-patch-repair endonuclease